MGSISNQTQTVVIPPDIPSTTPSINPNPITQITNISQQPNPSNLSHLKTPSSYEKKAQKEKLEKIQEKPSKNSEGVYPYTSLNMQNNISQQQQEKPPHTPHPNLNAYIVQQDGYERKPTTSELVVKEKTGGYVTYHQQLQQKLEQQAKLNNLTSISRESIILHQIKFQQQQQKLQEQYQQEILKERQQALAQQQQQQVFQQQQALGEGQSDNSKLMQYSNQFQQKGGATMNNLSGYNQSAYIVPGIQPTGPMGVYSSQTRPDGSQQMNPTLPGQVDCNGKNPRLQQQQYSIDDQLRHYFSLEQPVVIPSFANWFNHNQIHQLERDSLPEFFEGRSLKTPEYYMKIRNYIIELYRQNPRAYLTATICRKNLAGDACAVLRIHAFQEHWGLINFNFDRANHNYSNMTSKPSLHPDRVSAKLDVLTQERAMFETTDPDQYFETIQSVSKTVRPVCNSCGFVCGFTWYFKESTFVPGGTTTTAILPQQQILGNNDLASITDNSMVTDKPIDNNTQILQSTSSIVNELDKTTSPNISDKISKRITFVVCVKCFNEKNYPIIYSESEFTKSDLENYLEKRCQEKDTEWTKEETAQLLKNIQNIGPNGENSREFFGKFPNHKPESVVYHFLNLPFDDITPLDVFDKKHENRFTEEHFDALRSQSNHDPKSYDDLNNPMMEHVAVFKVLLDKANSDSLLEKRSYNKFEKNGEIDEEVDGILKSLNQLTAEDRQDLLELKEEFRSNSEVLKDKSEIKLFEFLSVMCELQMTKIENKIIFQDEYEKLLHHEKVFIEVCFWLIKIKIGL